jgi:hypothetical protein
MPWCPRCDEIFPEGPACPRCSTRLVDRERGGFGEEVQPVADFPMIKVSRRDRRALERLSGPKAPSSRVLAAAVAALVFAVGFLLGRLGTVEPAGPSVRALPAAEALTTFDVDGSAAYLLWTEEPLATLALHTLSTGDVVPRARLTPPFDPTYDARTYVSAFERNVALIVADGDRSFVAFAEAGATPHGWIPGVEAAWSSLMELLIRQADGTVVQWSTRAGSIQERRWGHAERLHQTSGGAVVEQNGRLVAARGEHEDLVLPPLGRGERVMATDGRRALIGGSEAMLWDGRTSARVRADGFRTLSAAFDATGERAAAVMQRGDELSVAVIDARGDAALKPLDARTGECAPAVSWDRTGSWIYVAPGDGALYAVEASGGHVESVRTHGVGCGLAWLA